MNCHGNKNENGKAKKHSPIKHMLMMVFCCGLPLLLIGILPFINIGGEFKIAIAGVIPFICPLMMMFMIPMMFKSMKREECCSEKKEVNGEQIKVE